MWISKQVIRQNSIPAAECGTVTMNSSDGIEAVSTGTQRSIQLYAPYGYYCNIPEGERVILTQSSGEQAVLGVLSSPGALKSGEIKLCAPSGAYIYLKNDGSVLINGLKITREGKIIGL